MKNSLSTAFKLHEILSAKTTSVIMVILITIATLSLTSCSKSADPTPAKPPVKKDTTYVVSNIKIDGYASPLSFTATYDVTGQVTQIVDVSGANHNFTYDKVNHRITRTTTDRIVIYQFSADSLLLSTTTAMNGSVTYAITFTYSGKHLVRMNWSSNEWYDINWNNDQITSAIHKTLLNGDTIAATNDSTPWIITNNTKVNPLLKLAPAMALMILDDFSFPFVYWFSPNAITHITNTYVNDEISTQNDSHGNLSNMLLKNQTSPSNGAPDIIASFGWTMVIN